MAAYQDQLIERFANPEILDTLARVAAYGTNWMPKFVLPVAAELVRDGGDLRTVAAVVAAWSVFCAGVDEAGRPLELADRLAGHLRGAAEAAAVEPLAWLELAVVPTEVRESAGFRAASSTPAHSWRPAASAAWLPVSRRDRRCRCGGFAHPDRHFM